VVLAPFFVWLYQLIPWAPFALNAAIMAGLFYYAFRSPQLRNADPTPATRADAAQATLDRRDESGQ
jgi:hypothetical protein